MTRVTEIKNLSSAELARRIKFMSESEWIDLYVIELESRIADLEAEGRKLDRDLTQVIDGRDEAVDMADKLAYGVAETLQMDIGEHSMLNDPHERALELMPVLKAKLAEREWHDLRKDPEDLPTKPGRCLTFDSGGDVDVARWIDDEDGRYWSCATYGFDSDEVIAWKEITPPQGEPAQPQEGE